MTHNLALEIDHQHEHAGWIDCWLMLDDERYHLDASWAFPPFLPLLRFLKAIKGQRFPAHCYWDEEGTVADFTATAVAEDSPLMHLRIVYDEGDTLWFDDVIERDTVIQALLPPLMDFFENFPRSESQWEAPKRVVGQLHRAIVKGIPLRSDLHSSQAVEVGVQGRYDLALVDGRVFFNIVFEAETLVSILLFDTHPFWLQLLDFFGAIAHNTLPATCEHSRLVEVGTPEPKRGLTRLCAEPLAAPENFRLKIWTAWNEEPEFLLLDEVVAREPFVRGFAKAFKTFLATDYQRVPDAQGNTFDLRTLPLEQLAWPE